MNILSIETSCDDTGVAVLRAQGSERPRFEILSNVLSSQTEIHEQYGGVYPMAAQREHEKNLPAAIARALKEAGKVKIEYVVVTNGPGLSPCLWTGVNVAKETANKLGVPLVPANHVEGHVLVSLFSHGRKLELSDGIFPAVALIVSGGHTQLIVVR
ncbi:MAG: tRNA (adenosine(37)-N6)-threonylcarbamoyltransferase complex transferase subunit TsaD, partial [Candidatus Pacearchaeota archaeon]|nr:tRNA (adenosine(37)-N6)-threonylcarbamoyltransferase complex transferase subunit TsaD [Candidatus Pacearchaeota archaeon]